MIKAENEDKLYMLYCNVYSNLETKDRNFNKFCDNKQANIFKVEKLRPKQENTLKDIELILKNRR